MFFFLFFSFFLFIEAQYAQNDKRAKFYLNLFLGDSEWSSNVKYVSYSQYLSLLVFFFF